MNNKTDLLILQTIIDGVKANNALTPQRAINFNIAHGLKAGTQILMADGSSKNIEDIVYGDIIQSQDPYEKKPVIVKAYGAIALGYADSWTRVIFTNGQFIDVNQEARIYSRSMARPIKLSEWEDKDGSYTVANTRAQVRTRAHYEDIQYSYSYILLTENFFYFANGILCGHMPQDLYKYPISAATDKERELFASIAETWRANEMLRNSNPQFLYEIGDTPLLSEKCTQKMATCQNKLQYATLWGERKVYNDLIMRTQELYNIRNKKSVTTLFRELHSQQIARINASQ